MSNELESTAAEAMPEKWVNLEDIADHLSVSTDTVRNWIKDGKLPFYKAGKRYKFKISEVDAWLRDGKDFGLNNIENSIEGGELL